MRPARSLMALLAVGTGLLAGTIPADRSAAQPKKLVYWTVWDQNPDFTKWYQG
jgi:hypothetical protein